MYQPKHFHFPLSPSSYQQCSTLTPHFGVFDQRARRRRRRCNCWLITILLRASFAHFDFNDVIMQCGKTQHRVLTMPNWILISFVKDTRASHWKMLDGKFMYVSAAEWRLSPLTVVDGVEIYLCGRAHKFQRQLGDWFQLFVIRTLEKRRTYEQIWAVFCCCCIFECVNCAIWDYPVEK